MSRLWGQDRGQVWLSVFFCPVTAQVGMDRQKTMILKDAHADWLAFFRKKKEDVS